MSFVNKKWIRDFCKKHNRRVSAAFLKRLEMDIVYHLEQAVEVKDGGKMTIGPVVADWVGLKFPDHMPRMKSVDKGRPVPCSDFEFVKAEDSDKGDN